MIELDPDYVKAYYNRGTSKNNLGQYEPAIRDFDKAIELDPDYAKAYNNRGTSKHNLGQYESAIRDYDKAIQLDPGNAFAYNNRGISKNNLGQYESAIRDLDKAIQLDPGYVKAYNNRGYSYEKMGRTYDAMADYQLALRVDPEYETAKGNFERILRKIQNPSSASNEQRVWALAVGVGVYKEDYKLQTLSFPPVQAERFANYLEQIGVTENSEIATLINSQATRDEIKTSIQRELCSSRVQPDDLVLFYFSGHGLANQQDIGICPYDFTDTRNWITEKEIVDLLARSPAKHKIVILEACKSRTLMAPALPPETRQQYSEKRKTFPSGTIVITSTQPGSESYENQFDGGYFTYYLLQGIEGRADSNRDKMVSVRELFQYVSTNVKSRTNNAQIPEINVNVYGAMGDLPLVPCH